MEKSNNQNSDIAIIGISCMTAGATDHRQFWRNVMDGVCSITDIPPGRWDVDRFYSKNHRDRDKICSKKGGFIPAIAFNPLDYGMPSDQVSSTEPLQLLSLEAVNMVLNDAGYESRPFDRDRTAVIFGTGGGLGELEHRYIFRTYLSQYFDGELPEALLDQLPKWNKDALPGILPSVTAGRIANRFGFGGPNFVTDAACASSLVAVQMGVRELIAGTSDFAIVGGADTYMGPFTYLSFCRTQALSESGNCKPFDNAADGTVMGEAIAVIMMKRLSDALRDGDRVYARIKGLGGSSDGRGKGLTAPNLDGQVRCLERAYEYSGVSPDTIGLIEAHGTGTVVGDTTEIESLRRIFSSAQIRPQSIPIGSVKSMIGHAKTAAGIISLIKTALALYYKVLPPTIGIDKPITPLSDSPFYPNMAARPWIHGSKKRPRRAGVSAFGFGGTNFHAVLEENPGAEPCVSPERPCELFCLRGESFEELYAHMQTARARLAENKTASLYSTAHEVWNENRECTGLTISIIADSIEDLEIKLDKAMNRVSADRKRALEGADDIWFFPDAGGCVGQIAFMFPGQGAQYTNMFAEAAVYFKEIREAFEAADETLDEKVPGGISRLVFPPHAFTAAQKKSASDVLAQTEIAQPALGAAEMGMYALFRGLGIVPDFLAGHSYGEYAALCASGVMDVETLYALSYARGAIIRDKSSDIKGAMAAAQTDAQTVRFALATLDGVWISNRNSPRQTVISGSVESINAAMEKLGDAGVDVKLLAVSCAFHSPLVAPARESLADLLGAATFNAPLIPVFSNLTGERYPLSSDGFSAMLADHLVNGVDFVKEIETMFDAGARIFVECGPRSVLSGLVGQILNGKEITMVAVDAPGGGGVRGFLGAMAHLAARGAALNLDRLFDRAQTGAAPGRDGGAKPASKKPSWMVDGGMAWKTENTPEDFAHGRPVVKRVPLGEIAGQSAANAGKGQNDMSGPLNSPIHNSVLFQDFFERQRQLTKQLLDLQESLLRALGGAPSAAPFLPPLESSIDGASLFGEPMAFDAASVFSPANNPPGESTASVVLGIVSERTGYPGEMLDLDAKLEADLGIDSIKRTEISGAIRKRFPELPPRAGHLLANASTLRTIIDLVENNVPATKTVAAVAEITAFVDGAEETKLAPRFRVEAAAAPAPGPLPAAALTPGAIVIITSDGAGLAEKVAARLREAEMLPILFVNRKSGESGECIPVDLSNPSSIRKAIEQKCAGKPVAGVLHLAPLRPATVFSEMSFAEWNERIKGDCASLLLLAQAALPHFEAALLRGELPFFMGVVQDSALTAESHPGDCAPWHGGVAGFINSLALEWPALHCRTVDISLCAEHDRVKAIFDEMTGRDAHRLIAYKGGDRLAPRLVKRDYAAAAEGIHVGPQSSIIITGGARGITSEIAIELAARYQPKMLIVGRSTFPKTEPSDTAGITSKRELIAILGKRPGSGGHKLTIREIERACERLLADREIVKTMAALRQAGAHARYLALDVATEAGMDELIATALRDFGRIDGIVHGAGINEDFLIIDKKPESFSRVVDTKANSAFLLSRAAHKLSLQFLVFFSSVARFGSAGQADYAAANEILDLIAQAPLNRAPCKTVSISWGPWLNRGMTEKLDRSIFESKGCELIRSIDGRSWFIEELARGGARDPSIVLGSGPWIPGNDDAARRADSPQFTKTEVLHEVPVD